MRKALFFLTAAAALLLPPVFPGGQALAGEEAAKEGGAKPEGGDKSDDKKKNAVHKITQSESYVMIEPFYTSIMDGSRPQGLLMVGLGLDIPDKALRERLDREMPRLRDAYVRALMSFAATNVRAFRQPDVDDMADRLQTVTDRYFARKGAKLLLAQVMIRLNK